MECTQLGRSGLVMSDLPVDQWQRLDDISAPSNVPVTGVPIAFAS